MEQLKLNMIPNGVNPVFHASQYDKGRQIRFVLDETLSSAEVTVSYRAKDGNEYGNVQMSVSGNTITDTIPEEVLTDYGIIEGEVNIDGIGSLNFFVEVEKDAYDGGVITTQTATGAIATFETNIETAFVSLKSDINPVQDLHGYSKPWSGGGGKNKFNDTTGTHTINANTDTTITIGDVYLEANTTYTISCKQTPAPLTSFVRNTLSVVGNGTTTYNPAGNDYTIKPMVFTPTVSGTYSIRVWGHTLSANTTYSQFQVEVGSTATAYEPYENICPISGFSALNVTRTGKNLFDIEKWLTDNNVSFTKIGDYYKLSVASNLFSNFFEFPAGIKTLTFEINQSETTTTNFRMQVKLQDGSITNIYTQNLPYTSNIIGVAFNWSTVGTLCIKVQVELGSTATDYEAYNGQAKTIDFGQTVYGGVLDVTNGKLTITHGIVDLGSLNWTYKTSGSQLAPYFYTDFSGIKFRGNPAVTKYNFLCPIYESVRRNVSTFVDGKICADGSLTEVTQIQIKDSRYTDAVSFKTAMSGVMFCYELATPIEITTTPENLTALSGQTNNVYGDTNGDTEVEYYIEV